MVEILSKESVNYRRMDGAPSFPEACQKCLEDFSALKPKPVRAAYVVRLNDEDSNKFVSVTLVFEDKKVVCEMTADELLGLEEEQI